MDAKLHSMYRPLQVNGIHDRIYYVEHAPSVHLTAYITCYWESGYAEVGQLGGHHERGGHDQGIGGRVLPDGCTDMLITYNPVLRKQTYTYCGNYTRPFAISLQSAADLGVAGEYTFGVRFFPGGAGRFHGLPLDQFTDQRLSLLDLWPEQLNELRERMAVSTCFADRVRLMDGYFSQLAETRDVPCQDDVLKNVLHHILSKGGRVGVKELAEREAMSERHLLRRFKRSVGINPKRFNEIVQFHQALHSIRGGWSTDWAQLADKHGYYDQAHLIRQFRKLYGDTPVTAARELQPQVVRFVQ